MDIGIRELKQRLSEMLDRAERGEVIRVTDRGVPKVVISKIADTGALEAGIADGWVRPARRSGLEPVRRVSAQRAVRDVLSEDRSE
jgi:prevent-host-death family protein